MSEKRKREAVVRELFTQKKIRSSDGSEVTVSCCTLCGEGGKPLHCETTYNLKRHLIAKHRKEAEENHLCGVAENKEADSAVPKSDDQQKLQKVTLFIDKNVYVTSLVQWITECNLPKHFFSKLCVSRVLHPLENAMKLNCVSRKNIMRYVEVVESRMIAHISQLMAGKLVCIKADLATRKGRSILGINAQFAMNGKIVVVTLAMVESFERNTAEKIYDEITKVLQKYNIDLRNVYSITTDNGSNFLKAAKLMREAQFVVLNGIELEEGPEADKERVLHDEHEIEDTGAESDDENTK